MAVASCGGAPSTARLAGCTQHTLALPCCKIATSKTGTDWRTPYTWDQAQVLVWLTAGTVMVKYWCGSVVRRPSPSILSQSNLLIYLKYSGQVCVLSVSQPSSISLSRSSQTPQYGCHSCCKSCTCCDDHPCTSGNPGPSSSTAGSSCSSQCPTPDCLTAQGLCNRHL